MKFFELKKQQEINALDLVDFEHRWDSSQSNPIDDFKKGVELASKCESFYMRSMRWLFGGYLGGVEKN